MIHSQRQKPHGAASPGPTTASLPSRTPPNTASPPCPVGNTNPTTPIANAMNTNATTVNNITRRPRQSARYRACNNPANTNHNATVLTTFGSVHLNAA